MRPIHMDFDPDGSADPNDGLFGVPVEEHAAQVVVLPVPWEPTVSSGRGTARAPANIRQASGQLDLYDPELSTIGLGEPWRHGIFMAPSSPTVQSWNDDACARARPVVDAGGPGTDAQHLEACAVVDRLAEQLCAHVREQAVARIDAGKIVGLVGGDHSAALGAIEAHAKRYDSLGILQIDAHADLRDAYEGFVHSHASVMHNVLRRTEPSVRLVQVGVRDLSPAEAARARDDERVTTVYDYELRQRRADAESWSSVCASIVDLLPSNVYVSLDIDGLAPAFCPGTGTPVPGGLSFGELMTLLMTVARAGKTVVGFDLVEVGEGPLDGNVGARVLYRLSALALWTAGARDA